MNIVGYLKKHGTATFSERPIGEVDSLIFSQLAYLNFTGLLGFSAPEVTLGALSAAHADALVNDTLYPKNNKKLLDAITACRRFEKVKAGWFREYNSEREEVRFAAVTFLTDAGYYIAFRGTDITLLGWKEDFNMSFLQSIPSQKLALDYLEEVARKTKGDLIVGGHSKGGNLALYAGMYASDVQERIRTVYNHDGPGFREPVFTQSEYLRISERVQMTIPHDSLIGILFYHAENYKVVKSRSVLLGQHNPFAWAVKGERFAQLKGRTANSRRTDLALERWIAETDDPTRKRFVDVLFRVVKGSGAEKVPQFLQGAFDKWTGMKRAYEELSEEDRELIANGGKTLLHLWLHALKKTNK